MGHVNPYLMCPSCLYPYIKKSKVFESFHNSIFCYSILPPLFYHGHLLSVMRVSPHRGLYEAFIASKLSLNKGQVLLYHLFLF